MDPDTIPTTLYVLVDEWCEGRPSPRWVGRPTALTRSEMVTLALFGPGTCLADRWRD